MEDLRALAEAFIVAFCRENGLKTKTIDPSVYATLERRSFPGNVRELKNVIERAAILSADVVTVADLPEDPHANPFDDDLTAGDAAPTGFAAASASTEHEPSEAIRNAGHATEASRRATLREFRDRAERAYIIEILSSLEWNISRAAIVLGVERTNLHKKIRAYGIKRGEAS
jgi:DNA-binding NtrC family response regulator